MNQDNIDSMLHWVREREAVRIKKDAGETHPWTNDVILNEHRFCNVRREDDRVTVWIRKNIREQFAGHPHLWFMLCIARQINWPDTLEMLIHMEGAWPDQASFDPKAMGEHLEDRARRGDKVFTGAYNITAPPTKGAKKTTFVAEHTLGELWRSRDAILTVLLSSGVTLKRVHSTLTRFDCWGPFMAYQAVVDMRFTPLLLGAIDVDNWAAAGPGTLRGLNRMAGRLVTAPISQSQALSEMLRLAKLVRQETNIDFDFSDMPNIMCESDKYIRLKNGEGTVRAKYVPGRGS